MFNVTFFPVKCQVVINSEKVKFNNLSFDMSLIFLHYMCIYFQDD